MNIEQLMKGYEMSLQKRVQAEEEVKTMRDRTAIIEKLGDVRYNEREAFNALASGAKDSALAPEIKRSTFERMTPEHKMEFVTKLHGKVVN